MFRTALVVATLGLSLIACRGGDDTNTADGGPMPDGPVIAGEVSIQEVQNDAMASGTSIELKGVVVTAIDSFGKNTGGFFVSEPEGGPFSGVKVFGAPLDVVATLVVGDTVDITGAIKHEACNQAAPCGTIVFDNGASITEVMGLSAGSLVVTKTGTGTPPTPAEVDAAAISLLPTKAERDAEWEKWEGVLVKVIKARQLADVSPFGGADSMEDENEFRATGFARVQSALVALPDTAVFGTCYESITGIVDFFFNYSIAPRTQADLVTGGTACRPMATTVAMLQSGANTEIASLTDVYVTALDNLGNTSKGFWVADSLQGAENNGVLVFTRDVVPAPELVPGAKIATLQGGVEEFDLAPMGQTVMGDTITELTNPLPATLSVTAPAGLPTPATTASVETLATIGAAGEVWEGVLVRIGPVKVTTADAGFGKILVTDNNGKTIHIDDDSFQFPTNTSPAAGACLTVTGVMSVAVFDDLRTINPRSLADVVVTTGCN